MRPLTETELVKITHTRDAPLRFGQLTDKEQLTCHTYQAQFAWLTNGQTEKQIWVLKLIGLDSLRSLLLGDTNRNPKTISKFHVGYFASSETINIFFNTPGSVASLGLRAFTNQKLHPQYSFRLNRDN